MSEKKKKKKESLKKKMYSSKKVCSKRSLSIQEIEEAAKRTKFNPNQPLNINRKPRSFENSTSSEEFSLENYINEANKENKEPPTTKNKDYPKNPKCNSNLQSENFKRKVKSQDSIANKEFRVENLIKNEQNSIKNEQEAEKTQPVWPDDPSKQTPEGSFEKYDWECLHLPRYIDLLGIFFMSYSK